MRVPNRAAVEAWGKRPNDLGVENLGAHEENGGPLIVVRDPDNIKREIDRALRAVRSVRRRVQQRCDRRWW
jgi:hypothetical protein